MRTINFTVKIEDNDLTEHNLRTHLEGLFSDKSISIKTLPNTDHLKDNESFKKLLKQKRNAQLLLDRYINENRL